MTSPSKTETILIITRNESKNFVASLDEKMIGSKPLKLALDNLVREIARHIKENENAA